MSPPDTETETCIVELFQDRNCDNPLLEDDIVCREHENYFETIDTETAADIIRDLDACAIHLEICNEHGQIDMAEQRYYTLLTNHLEDRGIPVTQHTNRVQAIYRNNPQSTASKRIETEQEAFLNDVLDEYDPVF